MDPHATLTQYISDQLHQGQSPDTIMMQLKQTGWTDEAIQQAFHSVQASVVPTVMQSTQPQSQPQANGKRRGKLKIGWQILMHSMQLLNNHRYLLRYFVMTWVAVIGINAAWIALFWFISPDFLYKPNHIIPSLFLGYLLIYACINFYAAAMSRNILDIYKAEKHEYGYYVKAARKHLGPILVYSAVEAVFALIFRMIIERLGKLGEFIAWLFGTAISLITMFVLPIIMDTQTGGLAAIKQSWNMLKENWGEGIAAKAGPGTVIALLQFAWCFIFGTIFRALIPVMHSFWAFFALAMVYFFVSISLAVIGSFASNVLSAALYYYAVNRQVPPGFTSEMLDNVFIKSRRQVKKEAKA